jgi:putative transposase
VSKSAASRHFVALSAARMKEWMGADLSALDIMAVQIDGIHISEFWWRRSGSIARASSTRSG